MYFLVRVKSIMFKSLDKFETSLKKIKISKGRTNLLILRTKVGIFVGNLKSNSEIFIIINAILKKKVRNMVLEIPDVVLNKQITIKGLQHYANCFYFLIAFPFFHSCV